MTSDTHIEISHEAISDMISVYGAPDFERTLQAWYVYNKNKYQMKYLKDLLINLNLPAYKVVDKIDENITEDKVAELSVAIVKAINDLTIALQLSGSTFTILGPSALLYVASNIAAMSDWDNLKVLFHDDFKDIYIMPSGEYGSISKSAVAVFDYQDGVNTGHDYQTGNRSYNFYNRGAIVVNPLNDSVSMFRRIEVTP